MKVLPMKKVAARVIARLKVMYPAFASKLDDDEEMTNLMIDEWSKGLRGILNQDIAHGLEVTRTSGSDFAPSLPKFIDYCGGRPTYQRAAIEYKADSTDYARLWIDADDKEKYRFFIDHPFSNVPGYVRQWFINYNKKHRGWDPHESNMMIKFHAAPSWHINSEFDENGNLDRKEKLGVMVAEHQRKILDYFTNRRSDG